MSQVRKELEEKLGERKSIIHIQNIFLTKPMQIYISRETREYVIGYELKSYSQHNLMYKISKRLTKEIKNPIEFNNSVDINVQENYRLSIKSTDTIWKISAKNVTVRIIPTRYSNLQPLYGIIIKYGWRHTWGGGRDKLEFKIRECPVISNSNSVNEICYKLIGRQISSGGSHGTHTYIIIAKEHGNYEIGKWIRASNYNIRGRRNIYEYPVNITL